MRCLVIHCDADTYRRNGKKLMQIDYDPEADAIYIRLRDGDIDHTVEASKYVFVDVDGAGVPLGLEILFAGRVLGKTDITSITVNVAPRSAGALVLAS